MAGFRHRSITLLVLFAFFSGIFIVGIGPHWGIDITGGSRIMLRIEATHATIDLADPTDNHVNEILTRMEENLNVPPPKVLENYKETGHLKVEIGRAVTEGMISPLLDEGDNILEVKTKVEDRTRDELIEALRARVDPYGTLGARFKSVGSEYIRFEVALGLDRAETLLGEVGRLEIFIGENLVLRGEHIESVGSWGYDSRMETYYVPFNLTDEGAQRFASATKGKGSTDEKRGYPGVIYLDRPVGAVLLFRETYQSTLLNAARAKGTGIEKAKYLENEHVFQFKQSRDRKGREGRWFTVQVKAFGIKTNEISDNTKNYLLNNIDQLTHVKFLGDASTLGENIYSGDNLIIDNQAELPVESVTQIAEWWKPAAGIESFPSISAEIAGDEEAARSGLRITTGAGDQSRSEAKDLKIVLSQRLPAQVSIASGEELDPRLGKAFLQEALKAGLAAFIAVGALVYIRYRRFKIVIPLMLTMLCEVGITLGFSSIIPETLLTLGLPEIGGIIAVVGTGVDHQIIITDEVISGGTSRGGRLPIERRTKRAFSIVFAAAATTIAAMIALAYVGLGAMRGFAIITMIGVSISVLITRPAYARIIGTLLEREQTK